MAEVLMPQMGESIVEGTITKWLKQLGDKIERDEALFEISTDKVDSEVPAPEAGVLEAVFFPEGETVEINTVVAFIGDGSKVGGHDAPSGTSAQAPSAEATSANGAATPPTAAPQAAVPVAAVSAPTPQGGRIRSSPLVRRIAKEEGVDLALIGSGSGQDGRITKKDILAHIEQRKNAPAPAPAAAASAATSSGTVLSTFHPTPEARFGDYSVEPLSNMRKSIAEHMVRSMHISPHVATLHRVDCTNIAKQRAAVKDAFLEQNSTKLTFLPFFLRAAASALKAYPTVNSSLDGSDLILHPEINIGIAVALDWGLIVPVIKGVDEKSVLGLQRSVNDLAERARKKQLKPDEITQGTFSISNYGSYNSLLATPAINQPQVAILGLGAITKEPVVVDDAIAIRSMAYLTLSFDHRVVDGALADLFLEHMRGTLEGWNESIL